MPMLPTLLKLREDCSELESNRRTGPYASLEEVLRGRGRLYGDGEDLRVMGEELGARYQFCITVFLRCFCSLAIWRGGTMSGLGS